MVKHRPSSTFLSPNKNKPAAFNYTTLLICVLAIIVGGYVLTNVFGISLSNLVFLAPFLICFGMHFLMMKMMGHRH